MKYDWSDTIASSMNSVLQDPEHQKMFSASGVLEKLAFTKVSDEDKPTEIEIELAAELSKEPLDSQLVVEPTVSMAAEDKSVNTLVKNAFDTLLKLSSELEEAGFEDLSGSTLVLASDLIVEAKAKKDKKDSKKDMNKAKDKAVREKAKAKAEKDKNAAKDKAMKEKAKDQKKHK